MAVFTDGNRIGAQHELERFAFRHLAVVEHMPSRAGLAAGFAAFQFGAQEIKPSLFLERAGVRSPLHISFLVEVPMIAFAANQS